MGGLEVTSAFDHIYAMVTGERMQFALRYKNERMDKVIAISAKLTESDSQAFTACATGLLKRMRDKTPKSLPAT